MARYYFHLQDGTAFPDNHGRELSTLQNARDAAIEYAGEVLRRIGHSRWQGEESLLKVANDRGVVLFTLSFCATDALVEAV